MDGVTSKTFISRERTNHDIAILLLLTWMLYMYVK